MTPPPDPITADRLRSPSPAGPRIFISYSRLDVAFVTRLTEGLQHAGFEVWVDLQGIRPTTQWLQEVFAAIDRATDFVFVLSPDSVQSRFCGLELDHALNRGKRLIPVMWRITQAIPTALQPIQWINFVTPDEFELSLQAVREALLTDNDWVAEHTRILARSVEWQQRSSRLLRGQDLREAERWLAELPPPNLRIIDLQRDYVRASRRRSRRALVIWTLAGIVLTVGIGIAGYLYLRTAPLQQAEALCSPPISTGNRAAGIRRLDWVSWARSDERVRSALAHCLSIADLKREPHELPRLAPAVLVLPPGLNEGPNLAFSAPTGQTLTAVAVHTRTADQYRMILLERTSGKIVDQVLFGAQGVAGIALAPQGSSVAVNVRTDKGQEVFVYSKGVGESMHPIKELDLDARANYSMSPARARITFSSDGRFLAAASFAGQVRVWNVDAVLSPFDRTPQPEISHQVDSSEAMAVAFNPESTRLATLGRDGMIRILELANDVEIAQAPVGTSFVLGDLINDFVWSAPDAIDLNGQRWSFTAPLQSTLLNRAGESNNHQIRSVAFTDDERLAALGVTSSSAQPLLSLGTSTVRVSFLEESEPNLAFATDGQTLYGAGVGALQAWTVAPRAHSTQRDGTRSVAAIAYDPTTSSIRMAGEQCAVSVLIASIEGTCCGEGDTPKRHRTEVSLGRGSLIDDTRPLLSADGSMVAVGYLAPDGNVTQILSVDGNLAPLRPFPVTADDFVSIPNRGFLAIDNTEGKVHDLERSREVALQGLRDNIGSHTAATRDGRLYSDTAANGSLRIWELRSGRLAHSIRREGAPLQDHKVFNPTGTHIAAFAGDQLSLWRVESGEPLARLTTDATFFWFAKDEARQEAINILHADGQIESWQPSNGVRQRLRRIHGLPQQDFNPVYHVTDDGRFLVQSGSYNSDQADLPGTRVWDLKTGQEVAALGDSQAFQTVSADGRRRARMLERCSTQLWTGKGIGSMSPIWTAFDESQTVDKLQLSRDGSRLLASERSAAPAETFYDRPETLHLFDIASRQEILAVQLNAKRLNCLALSPHGDRIVTCESEGNRFFDLTGQPIRSAMVPSDSKTVAAAVSEVMDIAAVAEDNGDVVLYKIRTGEILLRLDTGTPHLTTVALSPSGKWLIVGNANGGVFVWDLSSLRSQLRGVGLDWH